MKRDLKEIKKLDGEINKMIVSLDEKTNRKTELKKKLFYKLVEVGVLYEFEDKKEKEVYFNIQKINKYPMTPFFIRIFDNNRKQTSCNNCEETEILEIFMRTVEFKQALRDESIDYIIH